MQLLSITLIGRFVQIEEVYFKKSPIGVGVELGSVGYTVGWYLRFGKITYTCNIDFLLVDYLNITPWCFSFEGFSHHYHIAVSIYFLLHLALDWQCDCAINWNLHVIELLNQFG